MATLEEFHELTDAEDYFDFFDLDYDQRLVYVKRFHILKEFGAMMDRANDSAMENDEKLEFYKFALITVYKNFENGYAPSAADVWDMFGKESGCGTCSTSETCDDVEEVSNGVHACTSQQEIDFN